MFVSVRVGRVRSPGVSSRALLDYLKAWRVVLTVRQQGGVAGCKTGDRRVNGPN